MARGLSKDQVLELAWPGSAWAFVRLHWGTHCSFGTLTHASLYTNAQRQRQLGFVLDMKDS